MRAWWSRRCRSPAPDMDNAVLSLASQRRRSIRMQMKTRWIAAAVLAAAAAATQAQTVRIANQGDALSMDPHSLNESLQLSVTGNIYEGLVGRGKDLSLVPALATSWKQTSPTVWRFELRKGVQFHDGTPFTADDVVFSFQRTQADG